MLEKFFDPTKKNREPNLYEMTEERRELREAIRNAQESDDRLMGEIARAELLKLRTDQKQSYDNSGLIEKHKGVKGVISEIENQSLKYSREGYIDETEIEIQLGEEYVTISSIEKRIDELTEKINRILQKTSIEKDRIKRKTNLRLKDGLEDVRSDEESKLDKIRLENPKLVRAYELVSYKKGLQEEGHIAMTPSVKKYVEEIETKMLSGKPMFLHGPTGTGKTSLGRLAAHKLTGKDAEMVYCNQQTRESAIWGKQGIKVTEQGQPETIDILGPLARAIEAGKPIIFDEFNSLEEDQMRMIKGIFGYEPGDEVPITGNGKIKMAPGFQLIMTANLKSEKHPDRQDLPDEMKREFEQNNLEIGYSPEHESYDIMLARLMNEDGSVDLSWHDLNVTLPKLCEAMNSIQTAYTDELSKAESDGINNIGTKLPSLKSFVMTHGSIEAIIDLWNMEKKLGRKSRTFVEFVDERIKTALTFKAYTTEDRTLAAKIFVSKGFLQDTTPEEIGLPRNTFTGIQMATVSDPEKNIAESAKVTHISIKELAGLDPFEVHGIDIDPLDDFVDPEAMSTDPFMKSILEQMKKISLEGNLEHIDSIITTYTNPDGSIDSIELSLEKNLERFTNFYTQHNIDIPPDFNQTITEIWNKNADKIKQAIEEEGFDDVLFIPPYDIMDINQKTTEHGDYLKDGVPTKTWTSTTIDNAGGIQAITDTKPNQPRIVLIHRKNAENLQRPEISQTKDKSIYDLCNATTEQEQQHINELIQNKKPLPIDVLTLGEYLIADRLHFQETGQHLDEKTWTWLPASYSGSRVVCSDWHPDVSRVLVDANFPGFSHSSLGARSSRTFSL
jgi:hypothetical protein